VVDGHEAHGRHDTARLEQHPEFNPTEAPLMVGAGPSSFMGAHAPEEQFSQPFPEEAIERTDGRQAGKGYSTTGIKA
jgi:hypothetical protein